MVACGRCRGGRGANLSPADDLKGQVALVVECSAHEQAVLDGLNLLVQGGEMVLVGVPAVRHTEIYAQTILNRIFRQGLVLRSGTEWQIPRHPQPYRPNTNFGNMAGALRWLVEGSLEVGALYEVRDPSDPQRIYQDLLHRRTARPAVVLDWTQLRG